MTVGLLPTALTTPVPEGRGRWRLMLYNRQYSSAAPTLISELTDARGRQLAQKLNGPATLTFTLDGRSDAAALVQELTTDVVLTRWSDAAGTDVVYFRGIVGQSEDQLSEQEHAVTFTAHDYLAMLARRYVTNTLAWTATDQDNIANGLLSAALNVRATPGTPSFTPGSYLPLQALFVNPDGTQRSVSGQLRDRTYAGSTEVLTAIDDLAHVINGFDYDVVPGMSPRVTPNRPYDWMRIFYPSQGVTRTEPLEYGSTIASVTRTVNSADYANFERVLGNNASSDPAAPQLYSEKWNADANNVTVAPVGLWMDAQNAADVSVGTTLDQQALGWLNINGVLVPSYTLGLRPGTFRDGALNMGDTVPVVIHSGKRLNVTTSQRIVGLTFDIGEDGEEDVSLTVGRPLTSLVDMLTATAADVNALARR
jgi:hypothetical protein